MPLLARGRHILQDLAVYKAAGEIQYRHESARKKVTPPFFSDVILPVGDN